MTKVLEVKLRPQVIFSLLLIVFFALFVWLAKDWRLQARLYPWAIGIPMLVLALVHTIREFKGRDNKQPVAQAGDTPVDFRFTRGIDPEVARRRAINIFSWIFGFFAGIWLFGFHLTIPAFFFLYLKLQSGERWGVSLVCSGVAWCIFWGLFDRLLHLPFPEGAIFSWLGLN